MNISIHDINPGEDTFSDTDTGEGAFLIFDTETTGFASKNSASVFNTSSWPHIVSIGWILLDKDLNKVSSGYYILNQDVIIPPVAKQVHGISNLMMKRQGVPPRLAYEKFMEDVAKANTIISHNLNFDLPVLLCDLYRNNFEHNIITEKSFVCTLQTGYHVCEVYDRRGARKSPRNEELYGYLYRNDASFKLEGAHNAYVDCIVTAKCFVGIVTMYSEYISEYIFKEEWIEPYHDDKDQMEDTPPVITFMGRDINTMYSANCDIDELQSCNPYVPGSDGFEYTAGFFRNKGVLVTGDLENFTRAQIKGVLEGLGADVKSGVSKRVEIVIVGDLPGASKMKKLDELRAGGCLIQIMSEEDLMKAIR